MENVCTAETTPYHAYSVTRLAQLVNKDAIEYGVIWAAVGAVWGGVAGSLAGGVGAVPGALAGALSDGEMGAQVGAAKGVYDWVSESWKMEHQLDHPTGCHKIVSTAESYLPAVHLH